MLKKIFSFLSSKKKFQMSEKSKKLYKEEFDKIKQKINSIDPAKETLVCYGTSLYSFTLAKLFYSKTSGLMNSGWDMSELIFENGRLPLPQGEFRGGIPSKKLNVIDMSKGGKFDERKSGYDVYFDGAFEYAFSVIKKESWDLKKIEKIITENNEMFTESQKHFYTRLEQHYKKLKLLPNHFYYQQMRVPVIIIGIVENKNLIKFPGSGIDGESHCENMKIIAVAVTEEEFDRKQTLQSKTCNELDIALTLLTKENFQEINDYYINRKIKKDFYSSKS